MFAQELKKMVMNIENQEWDSKNNFLIEEKSEKNQSFIGRIRLFYKTNIVYKTKRYYRRIKSTMDEPIFPF